MFNLIENNSQYKLLWINMDDYYSSCNEICWSYVFDREQSYIYLKKGMKTCNYIFY